ncbi:hypothetical protein CL176_00050 [Suicoccus acidiformans]|uniref:Beta-lactamase class A catalytic domain-containing protein n=1 Tax=Suicoccus acidiformans TaxID=2036206 RepID=A0A347WHI8_9LACT|nr:serine hydrolase [Suicoccus acidiformans]AXY24545.1 hypothetical protein CL176_00050 [Suicoccus acidiformans]
MKIKLHNLLSSCYLWCLLLILPCTKVQAEELVKESGIMSSYLNREDETSPYNEALMRVNGLEPLDVDKFDSIDALIYQLIEDYQINPENLSIAYTNLVDGDSFFLNEHQPRIAGSIYKFPLVAIYLEEVQAGNLTFDTIIPNTVPYESPDGSQGYFEASLQTLMDESILYSNNDSAWTLLYYLFHSWPGFQEALVEFSEYYELPIEYYGDNYMTAVEIDNSLRKVANNPDTYGYLIDLMHNAEPPQLFTSYIQTGMANKYGRIDEMINDAGIYYEDDQAIYTLTVLTENVAQADPFIEELALRVTEWTRSQVMKE